jgi:putative N6-adenine-specific DNA methylase
MPPARPSALDLFAVTAPGLEPLARTELVALRTAGARVDEGGVAFGGGLEAAMRANLWLRTASRVLVRVAEFDVTTFHEMERFARQIPWERYVGAGRPVRFRVTCRKSKLYHSDAVAQRLADALDRRLGGGARVAPPPAEDDAAADGDADGDAEAQLFVVRLFRDRCTISADTSGALLHRRGYRQAVAKAPLRETLAAAMLAGSGWSPAAPLADPLCGSGTIAIEAARWARRIAPGAARGFAFEQWPAFDAARWRALVDEARAGELAAAPCPILASDRDDGAIEAARSNAERAGVADSIEFAVLPVSAVMPPDGAVPGWVVANPPYGVRVGERERLRNLYVALGNLLRTRFPDWTAAFLVADRMLGDQLRLPLADALTTTNGGIPVRLAVARVP